MRLRNPFGRKPKEFPSHLWTQCPNCGEMLFNKQLARNQSVCTNCGHHFKLGAKERLELLADAKSFVEMDTDIVSADPLGFVDSKGSSVGGGRRLAVDFVDDAPLGVGQGDDELLR